MEGHQRQQGGGAWWCMVGGGRAVVHGGMVVRQAGGGRWCRQREGGGADKGRGLVLVGGWPGVLRGTSPGFGCCCTAYYTRHTSCCTADIVRCAVSQ